MFKPRNNKTQKKRPFITTTSTANDEDGTDNEEVNVDMSKRTKKRSKKHKESKKSRSKASVGIGLSFQNDEEDEGGNELDRNKNKNKKKKGKRGGMGFGATRIFGEEEPDAEEVVAEHDNKSSTTSMYGAEALQQLKEAQTYTTFTAREIPNDDNEDTLSAVVEDPRPESSLNRHKRRPTSIEDMENAVQQQEQDYIPLSSNDEPPQSAIFNGDDAVNVDLSSFGARPGDAELDVIKEEEADSEWADKLAKRGMSTVHAGRAASTRPQTATSATAFGKHNVDHDSASEMFGENTASNIASVMKVKTAMSNAISRIQDTKVELSSSMERRKAELQLLVVQKDRYQSEVANGEKMTLWFQSTRRHIANVVGAVRDLDPKLVEVERALLTLMEDETSASLQRQRDCEDDLVFILKEHNALESVLGRIVETSIDENERSNSIDEFGRDLSYLVNKERDARIFNRYGLMTQQLKELIEDPDDDKTFLAAKKYGDITDAEKSDVDEESLLSRKQALNMAMAAAISNTSDEFLSLLRIARVFQKWKQEFPDEFKSCFASASFVDLASVLVRLELCQIWDLVGIFKEKVDVESAAPSHQLRLENLKFFSDLQELRLHDEGCNRCVAAVMEKSVLPFFMRILEKTYNPHSTFQTQTACRNYACLLEQHLSTKSVWDLNECVKKRLLEAVTNIAIPIVSNDMNSSNRAKDDVNDRNLKLLMGSQTFRLKKLIINICRFWAPLFGSDEQDLAKTILLEAIATRLLPVLIHMREGSGPEKGAATEILVKVVEAIKAIGWLDRTDVMLFASPLRAAIKLFGLDT